MNLVQYKGKRYIAVMISGCHPGGPPCHPNSWFTVLCIIIETLKRENPVACVPKRGIHTRYVTRCSHAFPPPGRNGEHIHSVLTTGNCAVIWIMRKDLVVYVSIGRPDSELFSNSMKVSRGGIIMKSHCCDADTYNRKVGLFLRNARVSFIMQSTVRLAAKSGWAPLHDAKLS